MGYACPVCGVEQPDAVHLANHLAVTASLGREDHEEWLTEYVPDWGEMGPTELGDRLTEYAPAVDTPDPVTGPEPSPGHGPGHAHDHGPGRPPGLEDALAHQSRQPGRGSLSAEARGALEEARELTRQMYESEAGVEPESEPDAESDPEPVDGGDAAGDTTSDDENGDENENA